MTEAAPENPTSWRELRVKTSLGVLASAALLLITVLWQGFQINAATESNSDSVADLTGQMTDLQTKVAEMHGRQNAGVDIWELKELEELLYWKIEELTRNLTELQVRVDSAGTDGAEQWLIDDHHHTVGGAIALLK